MATTLERLEQLEVRVDELEREVLRLRAIVAALTPGADDGAHRDPLHESEALLSQHYPNRKPLLS